MNVQQGEHQSQKLKSGWEAHFIRYPGSTKWRIRGLGLTWVDGSMLWTKNYFIDRLGWQDMEFSTPDEASSFIEKNAPVDQ